MRTLLSTILQRAGFDVVGEAMCSAVAPPALVTEVMNAGASEFVVKPFQPSRLLETVRHALS